MKCILCLLVVPLLALADKNEDLLAAARSGDAAAVEALLKEGADLETKTPYGQTPLFLSVMQGKTAVANLLLEKGAKTDVRDTFYKMGMIDMALQRKHFETVRAVWAKDPGLAARSLQSVVLFADKDTIAAALAAKPSQEQLDRALNMALDMKKQDAAELLQQAGAKPPAPAPVIDLKILESYAGTYKSAQIPVEIKFWVREGKLVGQVTGQPEFTPRAKSEKEFVLTSVGAEFTFPTADTLTLKQGPGTYTFNKVN